MAGGASTGPVEVLVVSGVPAHLSETDLRRRALVTMRGRLESGTGRFDVGRTVQLPPVRELQVAVVSAQGASAVVLDGASVLIGHHGAGPAVSLIAFWGPWWAGITLIGVVGILLTSGWAWQAWVVARLDGVRRLPVRLWLLLVASAVMRVVLAVRGGQFFDYDEYRYLAGVDVFYLWTAGYPWEALLEAAGRNAHPLFALMVQPAILVHSLVASLAGETPSEVTGAVTAWVPAAMNGMASVLVIALVYAIAHRSAARQDEAWLAALLTAASATLTVTARHLVPYDIALAGLMVVVWLSLSPRYHWSQSLLVGGVLWLSVFTYFGLWWPATVVAAFHVLRVRPWSWQGSVRIMAGLTGAALPVAIAVLTGLATPSQIQSGLSHFAGTVVNGDFAEGWRLPWAFLWSMEGSLLLVWVVGAGLAAVHAREERASRPRVVYFGIAVACYLGLAVGAAVLEWFVVYDRLVRAVIPFLALSSAAGWIRVLRLVRHPRQATVALLALLMIVAANLAPHLAMRFPRELLLSLREARDGEVQVVETGAPGAEGLDPTEGRYALLNAGDLSPEAPFVPPTVPPEQIVATWPHPRGFPQFQFGGYTAATREAIRAFGLQMVLIDLYRPASIRPQEGGSW